MATIEIKVCPKCGAEHPATPEYFRFDVKSKGTLRSECKECTARYQAEYHLAHKDKANEYMKGYRVENKEQISTQKKGHVKLNYELYRNSWKSYRKENKGTIVKYMANYHLEHKETLGSYAKEYREGHRPEHRIQSHIRRSRLRKLPHTFTISQWGEAKTHFDNSCAYCGSKEPMTMEHFLAVTKDGGYTKDNIIPACMSCNISKNNALYSNWYPIQPFYSEERETKILKYLGYKNKEQQQSIF